MSSLKNMAKFFGSRDQTRFIVVGASNNPNKFGYKILNWYANRNLPVTPINPADPEVLGITAYKSLTSYAEASSPETLFSISIITPPSVSLSMVDEFQEFQNRINTLWFQPGSYDDSVIQKLKNANFEDKIIYQGNCILVSGDQGISEYYGKDSRL